MAATAAAIVGALAATAGAASSMMRSPAQGQENQDLQLGALQNAQNNQRNQALVQALINQRSIAGQTDAFGSTIKYDPASNQWISDLGQLPKDAQTAAQQAAISRNTTDLRAAQYANEQAQQRASAYGGVADTARRGVENFRPMAAEQLIGLLGQQVTNAQEQTYRPLIADTLRQFARTGTAAGPVLGQIGRDEAKSQRDALIDAQIKGMTSVGDINNQRRQGLEQTASTTSALANPSLQFSGIAGSGADNTMNAALLSRAQQAGVAPAYGMANMNAATEATNKAAGIAGGSLADPNYGINQFQRGATDIGTMMGSGGAIKNLIDIYNKKSSSGSVSGSFGSSADAVPANFNPYNLPATPSNSF